MVSGKPPRRSKSSNEPVTIDLQAEEAVPNPAASESPLEETTMPEEAAAASPFPEMKDDEAKRPDDAPLDGEPSSSSEEVFGTENPEPETVPPAARQKTSPSLPSLLAVGIFGGLVALAGAGSMQYAGFLPTIGPAPKDAIPDTNLTTELNALKDQVNALAAKANTMADTGQLAERLAALEAAAAVRSKMPTDAAAIDQLQQQLAANGETIASLQSAIADTAAKLSETENRLNDRLAQTENKLNEPRDDVEVARTIAVAALKAAIDRGGPFMTELDTLAGVTPDDPIIAGLRDYATTGIASRAELVRQFEDTADAILTAVHQPDPNQGLGERLLSSALSVIKVRPVGNVEGATPEAMVARMEDKLRNGDLQGAALEWNSLPEEGKAASTEFEKALRSRIEVEKLVGSALTKAVSGSQG
ncbi:MAG: mitofilin family membrane protein [Rhizobium sp.]